MMEKVSVSAPLTPDQKIQILTVQFVELKQRFEKLEALVHTLKADRIRPEFLSGDEL